jgi:hypothetical protein
MAVSPGTIHISRKMMMVTMRMVGMKRSSLLTI